MGSFTASEYLELLETYNQEVWPVPLLLLLLGGAAFIFCFVRAAYSHLIVNTILGLLWCWMGLVYQLLYFSLLSSAAYLFSLGFLIQGGIFFWFGLSRRTLTYQVIYGRRFFVGLILLLYAFVIYPVIGYYAGHHYPQMATFGLPAITTIFSFGLLLFSIKRIPWLILLIPFIWSIIGSLLAIRTGMIEDIPLLPAALIAGYLLAEFPRKKKLRSV